MCFLLDISIHVNHDKELKFQMTGAIQGRTNLFKFTLPDHIIAFKSCLGICVPIISYFQTFPLKLP